MMLVLIKLKDLILSQFILYKAMIRSYESILTKTAIQFQTPSQKQTTPSRLQSPIKSQSQQPKKQLRHEQKVCALLVKNILKNKLQNHFKLMLARLVFKKICYRLLVTKRKRILHEAYLTIRSFVQKYKLQTYYRYIDRNHEARIIAALLFKHTANIRKQVFLKFRKNLIRHRRVQYFCQVLNQSANRALKRLCLRPVLGVLKCAANRQNFKQYHVELINKIDALRLRSIKQASFEIVFNQTSIDDCTKSIDLKKSKMVQVTSLNTSRKQTLQQVREELKMMKASLDQQKLAKTRLFNERRKYNNSSKSMMNEAIKKFQKQKKAWQTQNEEWEFQFSQRQRLVFIREHYRQRSYQSYKRNQQLYAMIFQHQKQQIRHLFKSFPQMSDHLQHFRQSCEYYLKDNLKKRHIVKMYEKLEVQSSESEYHELEHENRVIKQTIRCFINNEYSKVLFNPNKGVGHMPILDDGQ